MGFELYSNFFLNVQNNVTLFLFFIDLTISRTLSDLSDFGHCMMFAFQATSFWIAYNMWVYADDRVSFFHSPAFQRELEHCGL